MATPTKTTPAAKRLSSTTPGVSKASPSRTISPQTNGTSLVAKGAGPRAAVPTKAAPPSRRPIPASNRSSPVPLRGDSPAPSNGEVVAVTAEALDAAFKRETEAKEELKLRIESLDETIASLTKENDNLRASLTHAETRMNEIYNDQARMEEELAGRLELADKLRSQIRELEKEKRDLTRRYNEQTAAFDAERQASYDNEQHLKSRIQSLTQAKKENSALRKRSLVEDDAKSIVSEAEFPGSTSDDPYDELKTPRSIKTHGGRETPKSDDNHDDEPAEMTALRLELSTLATSHASIQSTMQLLQAQLLDLKRVNSQLQEENEAWSVLVQQRTLAGTFDIAALGGLEPETVSGTASPQRDPDASSLRSTGRSTLDRVSELDEIAYEAEKEEGHKFNDNAELDPDLVDPELLRQSSASAGEGQYGERSELDPDVLASPRPGSRQSGRSRRRGATTSVPKGESLADLPITGPGLDLAAELGRAENSGAFVLEKPPKHTKKKSDQDKSAPSSHAEIEGLRTEVKNLKDANKALSLYASKIIDRIISMEGFENVLAVDFQQTPQTPVAPQGGFSKLVSAVTGSGPSKKPASRPTSMLVGRSSSNSSAPVEKLTTFESIGLSKSTSQPPSQSSNNPGASTNNNNVPDPRRSRRSLSFDFRGFSLFGGSQQSEAEKRAHDPSLRPLTLRPGSTTLHPNTSPTPPAARKLESQEDEDDRKERERLRATMRLMGIDPATQKAPTDLIRSPDLPPNSVRPLSTGGTVVGIGVTPSAPPSAAPQSNRWSFFRRNTVEIPVAPPPPPQALTAEALEQAEAENHLAVLDAREKIVKEEIAKGGGSGFTDIPTRESPSGERRSIGDEWRSRRSSLAASAENLRALKIGSSPGSHGRRDESEVGSVVFSAEDYD